MSDFKWKHFEGTIILNCVRWYCKYGISYRDLTEMMLERGLKLHHTSIYRWVQEYAPKLEKRLRWYYKPGLGESWRVDETYIKVKGKWKYLYRAITKSGQTIDFYLSNTRGAKAAKRFLSKAFRKMKDYEKPQTVNTDKAGAYDKAIRELQEEGKIAKDLIHRQVKYLNNNIEADHGKLKRLIKPTLGFKSMKSAYATIKGMEVMRMFKKKQFSIWILEKPNVLGEIRLIERQFQF